MKNQSLLFILIPLLFVFYSCEESGKKPFIKADASGGTLELLVVTDNTQQWNGSIGDTLRAFFSQMWNTMPQAEKKFTMANLEKNGFSKMFQPHHNILIITVDRSRTESLVETKEDLWASPQRVIKMSLPTAMDFFDEFEKNKDGMMKLFYQTEYERTDKTHKTALEKNVISSLEKTYHLSMNIPVGYKIAKQENN